MKFIPGNFKRYFAVSKILTYDMDDG